MPVFPFVQFEFTHSVGPPAGRYTVRREDDPDFQAQLRDRRAAEAEEAGQDPDDLEDLNAGIGTADVVVFQIRGAPPVRPRRLRGAPAAAVAELSDPAEVSITAVTAILATSMLSTDTAARKRMSMLRGSVEAQQEMVERGFGLVRRCVSAYRSAAADPYVPDLSPADSRTCRIGYGEGAQVVRGYWTEAIVAVPPKGRKITRTGRLMPVQATADILVGGGTVLESEGMLLAVLRDFDHGRFRAAAVTLAAAVDLLLAELDGQELAGSVANLSDKLEETREKIHEIAERGLAGQITAGDQIALKALAEEAGALVDAWRYVPLGFG